MSAVGEATSLAQRKVRAGQRLLIGVAGTTLDAAERELIAEIKPAGFVLFRRNVATPAQVLDLNRQLAELVPFPALLAVDQEGGRVQRIRDTRWPSARALGRVERYTEAVSRGLARELRAMGFNLNFAPVADVDSNPDNPIIGDRSYGTGPDEVCGHVVTFLRAHQEEGVIACAKHFPGHGDTSVDSHLALPAIHRDEDSLRRTELPPFAAAVEAGVGTVMSAHVVFRALDDVPATLSSRILPRLLRQELGFDGVVFSDDMEMKAVAGRYSLEEQVVKGTEATIDAFLVCETPDLQLALFRELVRAQEERVGQERAAVTAVERMHTLRRRFLTKAPPAPELSCVGSSEHLELAGEVNQRAGLA